MSTSPIVFDNGGGCNLTYTPTTANVTIPNINSISFGVDPAYSTSSAVVQYYTTNLPTTGITTQTNVTPNLYADASQYQYIYATPANGWNGNYIYPSNLQGNCYVNYAWAAPTEEDKKRWEEHDVRMRAAASKAEELLFLHLSDEQKKQYLDHGYFETKVSDKTYRIRKGSAGNVYLVDKGKEMFRYCAHPSDYKIPAQDAMLAQLLMLHTNEERFLKTANRTVLY